MTNWFVRALLLAFTFGALAVQQRSPGRLSVRATVQGSFSLAVTPDTGGTVYTAGTNSATVTIPVSGATRFLFRATGANIASNRYTLYVRIRSTASGWTMDGIDLTDSQEQILSVDGRFGTDALHNLINPQAAVASSITFRVVPN